MIRVIVDKFKSITGVAIMEQLILSMEKTMNGRQWLILVIKDKYPTGEQECKGHF